ncbi:MAG TPA: glycosyltransferase [Isosphaeraceae bacterium]|nr:glycosyltransferase [Isosphaeraceae bacterium]
MLPLPVRHDQEGRLLFETQAANGLERWAENFEHVTVTCILTPEKKLQARSSWTWRPVAELACAGSVEVVTLPWAFKPPLFFHHYGKTRKLLAGLIQRSNYLVFSICYTWGDWAALGCLEAIRQHRPYAVWTDLVDHQAVRFGAAGKPLVRKIYTRHVDANMVKLYHHYLIQRSRLGLFHGRDCYDAYAPYCPNPHVVHNIHLKPADAISARALENKIDEIGQRGPLRLGYLGRADTAKGALDWLDVTKRLLDCGHDIDATWMGDGPLLEDLRVRASELGISHRVKFPGFMADRQRVLEFLRSCQLFVFCHKVPESPRVLIEAIVCGTPIVGYDTPYPRDLIGANGWGKLTPQHDPAALARTIGLLDRDRDSLVEMVRSTSSAALSFNDAAVFHHRSELIKAYL